MHKPTAYYIHNIYICILYNYIGLILYHNISSKYLELSIESSHHFLIS